MADLRFFVTQEGTLNQGGSGNDTVFTFTGTYSSDTIKGVGGNDLISLTNQTTALTLRSNNSGAPYAAVSAGTAGAVKAVYSGKYESAGSIAESIFTAETSNTAGAAAEGVANVEVSAQVQTLQSTGIGVLRNSLIAGGQGNDSIYLGDQITTFQSVSIGGGQGNDVIGTFNSGGAVTGRVAALSGGQIRGGNGNDTVFVNSTGESAHQFKVVGNGGNDSVQFSAISAEIRSGLIGGGAGNDSVVVQAASSFNASVKGGAGNDSIDVIFSAVTTKALIEGDKAGSTGNDTIRLALDTYSSVTVNGGLGKDSIVISGSVDNGSNTFDLGGGNDTIFFQSAGVDTLSGSTVIGGAGNDSVLFQTMSAGGFQSALIKGGAGNDTITITDAGVGGSAGLVGGSVKGGGGSDSITFSGVGTVGGSATFVYSKFSESTLGGMDTLTFNTAAVSAGTTFASSQINISVAMGITTGVSGAGAVGQVSASGGFVVFSGYADNSLTARVSAVNAGYATTGDFAIFTTDNTTRYLFVQGGATDLVARLSDDNQLSAGLGTLQKSGNTIGLGF
jgi:hypothetical protein